MQRERRQGRERDYKNVREMLGVGDLGAKRDHFSRVDFSLGERVVFFSGWELGMRDISCVSKAVDLELLSI